MTIAELRKALLDYPSDLEVVGESGKPIQVSKEGCFGNSYIRIYEPIEAEFVFGSAGIKEFTPSWIPSEDLKNAKQKLSEDDLK